MTSLRPTQTGGRSHPSQLVGTDTEAKGRSGLLQSMACPQGSEAHQHRNGADSEDQR